MPGMVLLNEVGPRDGLQNQPRHVDCDDKLKLIQALVDAGLQSIEATSFVSPKAVPQMADAAELYPRLPSPHVTRYSALVPNVKGLERAYAAGAKEVAVVLSATETMNRRNINMGLDQALDVCVEVVSRSIALGVRPKAYVAVAFYCPYEGKTPEVVVMRQIARLLEAGAEEIVLADTIGAAAPGEVAALFDACVRRWGSERLAGHFHDTRGMGAANAWAAFHQGIRKFDSSIGGLGGCPFAPGAAGNVATEDLVMMFEQSGYSTGVDLQRLRGAVRLAGDLVGRQIGGRVTQWLDARDRYAHSASASAGGGCTTSGTTNGCVV